MIAAAARTTTATKETEAKKGSRNDVKKAENKAEQRQRQRRILTTSVSITKLQNRRQSALIIAGRAGRGSSPHTPLHRCPPSSCYLTLLAACPAGVARGLSTEAR